MAALQLSRVLENINRRTPVDAQGDEDGDEWTLLESDLLPDAMLFHTLSLHWKLIVPHSLRSKFALVRCKRGPKAGVWLHYLETPSQRAGYDVDCYEIDVW